MVPSVTYLFLKKCPEVVILVGLAVCLCPSFNDHLSYYVLDAVEGTGRTTVHEAVQVLFSGVRSRLGAGQRDHGGGRTVCQHFVFLGSRQKRRYGEAHSPVMQTAVLIRLWDNRRQTPKRA